MDCSFKNAGRFGKSPCNLSNSQGASHLSEGTADKSAATFAKSAFAD